MIGLEPGPNMIARIHTKQINAQHHTTINKQVLRASLDQATRNPCGTAMGFKPLVANSTLERLIGNREEQV